jgi:protein MpaA
VGRQTWIRPLPTLACALVAAAVLSVVFAWNSRPRQRTHRRPAVDGLVRRRVTLGWSSRGRPITATEQGDPDTQRRVLVVGAIHGNEPAGIAIARRLWRLGIPPESDRWVIDDLNPDGVAAATRQNGRGVDLNRNFPYAWRRLGRRGDQQFSGPRPLSEPESRIARALIVRLRPAATVWFHQPLGVVDESGGSLALERRFASLIGLPIRRLAQYPGSATGWQNHRFPRTTAFVVELPPGPVPRAGLARYQGGILALARLVTSGAG